MRSEIKTILPRTALRAYRRFHLAIAERRNANRTPAEVFSEIYRQKKWGGTGAFCSGSGSADDSIVGPYVATVREFLRSFGSERPIVVDLGCGDFAVASQFAAECSTYIGVDVVPELVRHLNASAGGARVPFVCLDIVQDELPAGEVCLIRQVFQHLSNQQIIKILAKLSRYSVVFVTEHYPLDGPTVIPNLDKVQGAGIRLYKRSGVYLDRPPFNVPKSDMALVLEVPGHSLDGVHDPGVIRTFRLALPKAH